MSESSSGANDCINKKNDLKEKWNVFIKPDGTYEKIALRGKDLLGENSDFLIEQATKRILNIDLINYYREQILKYPEYRNKELSSIDILVYVLGIAIYNYTEENGLEIRYPNKIEFIRIFRKKLTDDQFTTIFNLVKENGDSYDAMCEAFSSFKNRNNTVLMKKVI